MATTTILPRHIVKGKTIEQTMEASFEYGKKQKNNLMEYEELEQLAANKTDRFHALFCANL